MAVALSVLHILSSPKHRRWLTLPQYVRLGFFVTALGMLFRGVDLLNLSRPEASTASPGHIDGVGFVLTCSMSFTICALAFHAICNSCAPSVRARIESIERLARAGPKREALANLALDGFKAVESLGTFPPGR
jgi:hypothetical protein